MIKLKPFRQTPGLCGPASLKMVLDYYSISKSEAEIAKASGATRQKGVSIDGLVKAARHFGLHTFVKKNSSLDDLRYFVKRKIPVIVDWFFEDEGHYSVVVDIDKKNIVLMDPSLRKILIYIRRRKMPLDKFFRIWFDFKGDYIKNPKDIILRLIFVAAPFKEEFKIK
ncbi:MAG: cysteine peptidase family C39 domain-containing protein [Candidatus Pacebacteria bacterium]|nr:cysteine peptidase family C39 domain-containing protein [Candidatus Paceibacterota bacterium]